MVTQRENRIEFTAVSGSAAFILVLLVNCPGAAVSLRKQRMSKKQSVNGLEVLVSVEHGFGRKLNAILSDSKDRLYLARLASHEFDKPTVWEGKSVIPLKKVTSKALCAITPKRAIEWYYGLFQADYIGDSYYADPIKTDSIGIDGIPRLMRIAAAAM